MVEATSNTTDLLPASNTQQILPADWRWVRLDEVADIVNGFGFAENLQGRTDLPYPFIKVSDMNAAAAEVVISRAANTVDDDILRRLNARVYPAGTVIFPKVGGALLTNKKRILGVESTFDNNIMGAIPKVIDSKFLFYWMLTFDLRKLANVQALPSIKQSDVAALNIPLPPPSEQQRLTKILDGQMAVVQRALSAAKVQLHAAEALRRAYLREAFHRITPLGLNVVDEPAPEGWKWHPLVKLARLESGHTPSRYHPEWWGGDIPWIALPDIRALDGKVAYETSEYTNEAGIANSSARVLPAGTVVLSRTASVGFVTIMGRPMATSQDFVNWVCGPDLDPHFLALLFRASRNFILSIASGAVHKTVYVPTVKSFYVCVPDIQEQRRIAENLNYHLSGAEQALKALQQQVEYIDKLPALLLRRAFTGEL